MSRDEQVDDEINTNVDTTLNTARTEWIHAGATWQSSFNISLQQTPTVPLDMNDFSEASNESSGITFKTLTPKQRLASLDAGETRPSILATPDPSFIERLLESPPEWAMEAFDIAGPVLEKHMGWNRQDVMKNILPAYSIDKQDSVNIIDMPQRVFDWYKVRNGWITKDGVARGFLVSASVVSDILKHKKKWSGETAKLADGSPDLYQMFINTQRGTASEFYGREEVGIFLQKRLGDHYKVSIEEVGLHVPVSRPWIAASPDGIVHAYDTINHSYTRTGLEMKCVGSETASVYDHIKHEYYDQVMHTIAILRLCGVYDNAKDEYWFTVRSKHLFTIERYIYRFAYWEAQMKEVAQWYWGVYYPILVMVSGGYYDPSQDKLASMNGGNKSLYTKADGSMVPLKDMTNEQVMGYCYDLAFFTTPDSVVAWST